MQRLIIFANGELPSLQKARSLVQADDYIICADGGTRHALTLGVKPNLIVGDLDSADQTALEKFREEDVAIESYSADKNETDLELALTRALELSPRQIIIIAALGGRLDQTLANIALLSDPRLVGVDVRLDNGIEEIFVCRDQAEVHGKAGDLVSLLPWQADVPAVLTQNLKWPLLEETLYPHRTRGVSNEMISDSVSVSIGSGLLLIVHRRQS